MDSAENVGTTFSLWLPEADFTEADRERRQPRVGRRTLLLVAPPGKPVDDMASRSVVGFRAGNQRMIVEMLVKNPQA